MKSPDTEDKLQLPECIADTARISHWSVSPSGGGRHEAVVRPVVRPGGGALRSRQHAAGCSCAESGSGRSAAPLQLKSPPADSSAPSMRRLAGFLLPCAVALLVHLWLSQRPSSTPADSSTLPGTLEPPARLRRL